MRHWVVLAFKSNSETAHITDSVLPNTLTKTAEQYTSMAHGMLGKPAKPNWMKVCPATGLMLVLCKFLHTIPGCKYTYPWLQCPGLVQQKTRIGECATHPQGVGSPAAPREGQHALVRDRAGREAAAPRRRPFHVGLGLLGFALLLLYDLHGRGQTGWEGTEKCCSENTA